VSRFWLYAIVVADIPRNAHVVLSADIVVFQGGAMHESSRRDRDGLLIRGVVVGALVGGVAAWLFAPYKGAQLRARVEYTIRENMTKTWTTIRMVLPGSTDE
jgi:hypothetical protein